VRLDEAELGVRCARLPAAMSRVQYDERPTALRRSARRVDVDDDAIGIREIEHPATRTRLKVEHDAWIRSSEAYPLQATSFDELRNRDGVAPFDILELNGDSSGQDALRRVMGLPK
jgi:phosphopantetheine adenylyltransferase